MRDHQVVNTGIGTLPLNAMRFLKQHWLMMLCCVGAVVLGVAIVLVPDLLILATAVGLLLWIGWI